jgi:hypothetical protein
MKHDKVVFHGGCLGCSQQEKHGTDFCYDCRYFEADWSKPNLSNEVDPAEVERVKVRERRANKKPSKGALTLVINLFKPRTD